MTRPLIVLPEAEEELLEAMRWYEARRAGLGLELLGTVEHALVRIRVTLATIQRPRSRARYTARQ